MEKVLTQEEIDSMVRAARGTGGKTIAQTVTPWDARQAGQIGREQVQWISTLHESFARNLTHAVAAYLRIEFSAALVSAEHITYGEFLGSIPEVTYLASCKLAPHDATALLQLDLAVAFPIIDVLVGGEGKTTSTSAERRMTEIEEQILETVVRIICRELQTAWQALSLEFQFEDRQQANQVQRLMPPEEKTLSLSFEINVAQSRGSLNIVVPAAESNALLRKVSAGWERTKSRASPGSEQQLRRRLLNARFAAGLAMRIPRVPLREVVRLTAGALLKMPCTVDQLAVLEVGGERMFSARIARRGGQRLAQVIEHLGSETEQPPAQSLRYERS